MFGFGTLEVLSNTAKMSYANTYDIRACYDAIKFCMDIVNECWREFLICICRVRHSVKIENKKIWKLGKIDQFGAILLFDFHWMSIPVYMNSLATVKQQAICISCVFRIQLPVLHYYKRAIQSSYCCDMHEDLLSDSLTTLMKFYILLMGINKNK